jgi:hypothetical protein
MKMYLYLKSGSWHDDCKVSYYILINNVSIGHDIVGLRIYGRCF